MPVIEASADRRSGVNSVMFFEPPAPVSNLRLRRIVSGGQTGVDRAALDWAIGNGIDHGGWCPQGRRAEDGTINERYKLRETPLSKYAQRTEWNVRDSDGTLVVTISPRLVGGTKQTLELARKYKKPLLRLSRTVPLKQNAAAVRTFLHEHNIQTLNIAGPRSHEEPGVEDFVREILDAAAE
jgi:hypothetical protein